MSKTVIKLNRAGVSELLKSEWIQGVCNQLGESMLAELGDGYEMKSFVGFDRVHTVISAVSDEAIKDNLENNTMLKGMHE